MPAAGSPSRSSPSWSSASTAESRSIRAGNLAATGATGATHAAHLGNSVSELDPTYALQNANQGPAIDAEPFNIAGIGTYTSNTQVDNAGIDVRLTQLRNLLAGTRPQTNPGVPGLHPGLPDFTGHTNGDNNFILMNSVPYFMPNSIADIGDVDGYGASPPNAVLRLTPPVAGRWGEVQSVPGYPTIPNPNSPPPYLNLVTTTYNNRIRAGYSLDTTDIVNGAPAPQPTTTTTSSTPFRSVTPARSTTATSSTPPVV